MRAENKTPHAEGNRLVPMWFIAPPGAGLPDPWLERAVTVLLVPLLPSDIADLFAHETRAGLGDPAFLHLVASGVAARDIGRSLGITDRSVYRRLATLRDRLEVETNAELAAHLARRGF